jgi:flagellar hook protein FlgE
VFDSQGASHLAAVYFQKTAANSWQTALYIDGVNVPEDAGENGIVNFGTDGTIVAGAANSTVVYDPAYNPNAGVTAAMPLTINYDATTPSTQYGSSFNINSLVQDGYTTGRISSLDIGETGVVQARFTNGQNRVMGQIALANFSNPQGLVAIGGNAWVEGFSSGQPVIAAPGSGTLGVIQSGALEGSNVDITEQLVGMITAQRDFQANAQVISVADAMTQTIINLR